MRRLASAFGAASLVTVGAGAAVLVDFDAPAPTQGVVLAQGAAVVHDDVHGGVLDLPGHAYARLDPADRIRPGVGTISFWVRTHWRADDGASHVFLTARWTARDDAYLAVTYGWWEPTGSARLYFIVDNQQAMHCSAPYRFAPDTWTFVAVTWQSGAHGQCRVFVDGEKIAEHDATLAAGGATGPVYLGSDAGATNARGRASDFALDELRFEHAALGEAEIAQIHRARRAAWTGGTYKDTDWLAAAAAAPADLPRDAAGTPRETRALFDEDLHWALSRSETDMILARLKTAGFNVYVPCVWHGRGAHYASALLPPDERVRARIAAGDDPLAYLVARAHTLGIEVHPWFTVMRREWDRYPEFFPEGTPALAYDAHDAKFRGLIVDAMLDVVRRYDVDGLNLDYIRTMGICVSPACMRDYRARTGHELMSDSAAAPSSAEAAARVAAWQDAAVADIVGRVSAGARALRPAIVISVDGDPVPPGAARPLEGRDEITWANRGWVDAIFDMDYRAHVDWQTFDQVRTRLREPKRLVPLFGNYDDLDGKPVPRGADLVSGFVRLSRSRWPGSGEGFYIYAMLSDGQRDGLAGGVYAEPARAGWH